MKNKKRVMIYFVFSLIIANIFFSFAIAQTEPTVCCEKTKSSEEGRSGLFCQDVPKDECDDSSRQLPTSCESTSYCKPGVCYDSTEGTCTDNTPQIVCNANGGIWSQDSPAQCDLGCCILGDQAAFVTLVRCKKLSAELGLKTNYNTGIKTELECVLTASSQEKGACVFDFEFERTCKFTTRGDCSEGVGESTIKGEFFTGKLCSAEELATNCGPTRETTCVPGKDEVYFVDSCGNSANIYDASKLTDKRYWSDVISKSESCNPENADGNAVSASCGNCNYLLGSFCRNSKIAGARPSYGDNICADLNCKNTQNGKSYRHGESWCINNDEGETGQGNNAVGSRFYKHICINGEEVLEQCVDFRQEICIEDKIETTLGDFSQAACRVNRWQDCVAQTDKQDCENTDRRDCFWRESSDDKPLLFFEGASTEGACFPKDTPGLKFWEGAESLSICSQGNAECVVTYEKRIGGSYEKKENKKCLEKSWENERAGICMSIADCGPKINWIGKTGYKSGFNITKKDV